jgi:NADH-quinone oxidoreductase subunit G
MPTIFIDDQAYEVSDGRNVLQAALDNELDLPYFCWHPAMGSVGACRLCAVKHYRDEHDEHGRLAMGCMTPATDGTRVAINEPEAAQFRRSVVEWLMINHPHDCPVCDEGGECHLQDMTVMTGHAHRRYRGKKRTYRNQYLGPLVHHEMNRCIQCYRCVRFYCDHSGGDDLGVFASRDRVYFGRVEDGVLESPFAGNLVEVCPTGVFTDKTLRKHYTRKWDLESAPSLCTHCGLGCNTLMGARYGSARRVTGRFNSEVNGYWLCDRGRFGYGHLSAEDRLLSPQMLHSESGNMAATLAETWKEASRGVAAAAAAGTLAAVGSPRASLESNFALRSLSTPERFCGGTAEPERDLVARYADAARGGAFYVPSLQQVERADAVLVLGADLTNEAPLLDLALYRARENGAAIYVVGLSAGRPGEFATAVEHTDVHGCAGRAATIATSLAEGRHDDPLVAALAGAQRPLVISGTQHRDSRILQASLDLVAAIGTHATASFALALPEANTLGLALLDGGIGISVPALVRAMEDGRITALVVGENDLFARFEDHDRLAAALRGLDTLVVLDHMVTPSVALATHALPVCAVPESSGMLVNNEGRMQRFSQVLRPSDGVVPAWSVARDLIVDAGVSPDDDWQRSEDVTAALEAAVEAFVGATQVAPPTLPPRVGAPGWNSNEAINHLQIEVGGPLHGGGPGRRIFAAADATMDERAVHARADDAADAAASSTEDGRLLVCATAEIFGSEAMSQRAPALAELAPDNYLRVHPERAAALGVAHGEVRTMKLAGDGIEVRLEAAIVLDATLPSHVAAVPAGYPATRWWQRPLWMKIDAGESVS